MLPARGHVRGKPGTTVPGADGETLEPKGQNTAGYVMTRSGRWLAYALMVDLAARSRTSRATSPACSRTKQRSPTPATRECHE
jgi:D-alanyl-D-alanine carboxypeptidase